MKTKFLCTLLFLSLATLSQGQITPGFNPGNLAVLRVGNGLTALASTGNAVFLDVYTTNGVLTNSVSVPTNGSTSLIGAGSASSEGAISRSPNKNFITLAGYNTNLLNTVNLANATSAAVPRAIATIDYNGTFTFVTTTTTYFTANNMRSAVTDGSNNFWGAGAASGIVYLGLVSPAAVVQTTNTEVVSIFNGNLYFCSQKTLPIGISGFAGTPTAAATTTNFLTVSGPTSPSPYAFAISPDNTVAYVADDNTTNKGGGIQKYTNNGAAWGRAYTLVFAGASTAGARGVAVNFSQPPVIYATTADAASNHLVAITDNGPGSAVTVLATATTNEIFRGVQFSPEGSPPSIIPLQDQTVAVGQDALFSAPASGSGTLYYLWQSNQIPITTWSTDPALDLPTGSDSPGSFQIQVLVSNAWGTNSSQATLTLTPPNTPPPPPTIANEPQSVATNYGATVSFSVIAGGASLLYSWQRNGVDLSDGLNISGSSTNVLYLTNVSGADSGSYTVIVTNSGGSITSMPPAILTVTDPLILSQPAGQTWLAGNTLALSVGAVGTQLAYQWSLNGSNLSGATDSSYQKANLQSADAGSYSVLVTGTYGSALSATTSVLVATSRTTLFPTNLVVLRLGDGAQTLTNSGNTLFLDQFTPAGNYRGTMFIPDSGASALLISGVAGSEGFMTLSADGRILAIAGYNTNRGTLAGSLSSSTAASVPRAVGAVDGAGNYSLAVSTSSQYSADNFRAAASDGTNNFWGAGSADGTYYFGTNSPAASVQTAIANCRVINIVNGVLTFSTQSGTAGLYSLGGLPVSAAVTNRLFATGASSSPEDFAISPGGAIAYVADDSSIGGVQRWQKSAGIWTSNYTLATGVAGIGARSLTVDFSGANPVIYAITSDASTNRLIAITDAGPSSQPVKLATAAANEFFRAVKFGPALNPFPAPTLTAPALAGSQFSFGLSGVDGYSYVIESSADFTNWLPLQTNSAPFTFTLTNPPGTQFFRAVSH